MSRKAEMLRQRGYANIVEVPDDECLGEVASRQRRAVRPGIEPGTGPDMRRRELPVLVYMW